ncbi:MAG TPA: PA14 domain-containing protein, partial [Kofleriaceae bacterium]|nr:PA14 domain-containing protein [Kofleriaceae bacterium]
MRAVIAFAGLMAACTFHSPHGGDDGLGSDEMLRTIVEPSFTGAVTDGLIATRGALEPDAFARGGLHATAYAGNKIMDNSTYDQVIGQLVTPIGAGYRQIPFVWTDRPHGLGAPTNNSDFTIAYDGEILLPGGDHALAVFADDRAIVQIALDGATFGGDMFTHNNTTTFPIHIADSGWFPIRMVYGQEGGPDGFALTLDGVALTQALLRARIGKASGLVAYGFGNESLSLLEGESAVANVDASYAMAAPPFDLAFPTTKWGVRFAGQLLVETAGDYTLTVDIGPDASDGFRLWVDDAVIAAHWLGLSDVRAATVPLSAGWHDLLVDYAQHDLTAQVHLEMTPPNGTAAIVAADHLRPAVAFGHTTGYADQTVPGIPIADAAATPGVTVVPLFAPAISGGVIDFVDVGYGLFNARSTDLTEVINTGAA